MITKEASGHFFISLIKSVLRIVGGVILIINSNILCFAVCFVLAEVLGILEEMFDKR